MRPLLVVALAACASGRPAAPGPAPGNSPTTSTARQVARPEPTFHPDLDKLRRFHNYYRVVSVGEYRHHFVAFYHRHELGTALYDAPVTPGAPVHQIGVGFGLITRRPAAEPIPIAVRPLADRVAADLRANHEATDVLVLYLGAFRPVMVEEIVVREPNAHRSKLTTRKLVLAANEELTRVTGKARYFTGTGGSLRIGKLDEHADAPSWIDGQLPRHGRHQLWELYDQPSPIDPTVRGAFEEATLAAARRLVSKEPPLRIEQLAVEQDPRVLPPDLDAHRAVGFYVNPSGGGGQSSATASFIPARAFGGDERVELRLSLPVERLGSVVFEASLRLRGPRIPEGASGELELPLTVDYRVTAVVLGEKGRAGSVTTPARILIDGDRVHVLHLAAPIPSFTFGGAPGGTTFEAVLGLMGED